MNTVECARLYHAHHRAYTEDLPFWAEATARFPAPALELGCGTGRVLLPLREAGRPVFGVDFSLGMLAVLREEQPPAGAAAPVFAGEARSLGVAAASLGLVIFPCNTLSTFSIRGRRALFAEVHRLLRPEGGFLFSLPNPERLMSLPAVGVLELEMRLPHPSGRGEVSVFSAWERRETRFSMRWVYEWGGRGERHRCEQETVHLLEPPEHYLAALRAQGFAVSGVYGDFGGGAFDGQAPYLIVEARKT